MFYHERRKIYIDILRKSIWYADFLNIKIMQTAVYFSITVCILYTRWDIT